MEKEELENKIPGEEKDVEVESMETEGVAETGTAEDGEASVENQESDEYVENDEVGIEGEDVPENDIEDGSKNDIEDGSKNDIEDGSKNEIEDGSKNEIEDEPEKMLTQSQANELIGKARIEGRQSAMKELYGRYGVNDDNEMNDIFGRGQGYDLLNDEYNILNGKYGNLAAENALLKTQVVPGRWDDVKAILGSKGMQVTVENIEAEIATHPEWKNAAADVNVSAETQELTPEMAETMAEKSKAQTMSAPQVSQIRKLGTTVPNPQIDNEDADAMKWFGLK